MYIPWGRDFCLFCSLLYLQDLEQCQPHGRIQYLLKKSMTAYPKASSIHREVAERSIANEYKFYFLSMVHPCKSPLFLSKWVYLHCKKKKNQPSKHKK